MRHSMILFLILIVIYTQSSGQSGIITTVAGNGSISYTGDGGPATAAGLYTAFGVAADGLGNFYLSDSHYGVIRKINASGIITTVAGTGTYGYSGDGGPATAAQMGAITTLVADSYGNLYVPDNDNGRIRKISTSGIITTIAGTGFLGYAGDGGPATAAMISGSDCITIDVFGNIYYGDNERIRKISSSGIISTIAGNGTTGFSGDGGPATAASMYLPSGVVTDGAGNVYFSDEYNNRIRKINSYGIMSTIAGTGPYGGIAGSFGGDGGPAISAHLYAPVGLARDAYGNIYFDDNVNNRICKINPSGIISTIGGNGSTGYSGDGGPATNAQIYVSYELAMDYAGNLLLADVSNRRIRKINSGYPSPFFVGGHIENLVVCENSIARYINTLLAVYDTTTGLTASWSMITGPMHGSATVAYTAATTGGILTPTGLSYTPIVGYYGTDTFRVRVTDGLHSDTTLIAVNITMYDASIIAGPSIVCTGNTILLSDTSGGGVWSSGITGVATINSPSGVLTGIAGGIATITYTLPDGCYAVDLVTVNPAPSAITGLMSICTGISTTLSDSVAGGTWSSSNATIAPIIATSGVYTGYSPGSATITYSMPAGCSVTTSVTINTMPGPISGATSVCVGLITTLSDAVPGGNWSSSFLPVATIGTATGVVLGVSTGTTTIFYTLPHGCAVSTIVTVNTSAGAIAGPSQVCIAGAITLTDATGGGTWTSSAPGIATIGSTSGILTGLLTGTVTVTYSVGSGCSATKVITVNPLPALITGTPVVCAGSTSTLSDPMTGGTWSSSIPANGSINTLGVITGIAAGTTVIDYTLPATGCYSSVTATINPQPAVIGGPSSVCPGATITLTDASTGGSWSAGSGSVSIGSGTGIVLGITPGVATITYTLATGCTRTTVVTVNPLPSAISGSASVCQGSTTTLTDAGGGWWSTSGLAATIGSSTGVVTGVSAGTALITYTISTGCSITRTETVNPLPAAIGGPTALCVGSTITLTDPGGGTWGSFTPSVATVGASTGIVSGLITGTTTVTYSLPTGCTASEVVTVSTTPTAIAGPSTVCAGSSTTTFTDAIAGGIWTSTNLVAATIGSLSGTVTGIATGVTNISYSLGSGCTVAKTVTVIPSPATITGSGSICISGTAAMTDATTGGTWSITPTATGTISGTGIVTGLAAGVATVDYTASGCSAIKPVTVNAIPMPIGGSGSVCAGAMITETDAVTGGIWSTTGAAISVGSISGVVSGVSSGTGTLSYSIGSCSVSRIISVNPVPTISGSTGLCTGTTSTLTASITGGTWGGGALAVATVNATTGVVSGIAPGSTTITYTLSSGCSALVVVTVNGAPGGITGTLHVCAGATTTLSDGTGGGTWSISPSSIATIGSSSGLISAILSGTATVTYSLGSGCTVTALDTVIAVPAPIIGTSYICAGLTTALTDATTGGTWSSGSMATGTISSTGIVTGLVAGTTTISYTLSGCSATYPLTVNPLPSPIAGTTGWCAGLTSPFSDITPGGSWSCTPAAIATVNSTGVVLGVAGGIATISYTLPTGCVATKPITINSAPAAIAGSSLVCVGYTIALTDGTGGGTWSSTNTTVATAGSTGVVTGISVGTTVISYIVGGCPAIKTVTVSTPPAAISGPSAVCISATVMAVDAGGGIWSSSNPVIATIGSSSGVITGAAAGIATISYSLGAGCTVTETITVNPLPAPITGSSSNVCFGATLALADATPGGLWGSGSPTIASVSTTGVVTGVAAGVSIITYTAPSGCAVTRSITVISVSPISGVHNICAYGDTMTVSNVPGTGLFTSSLATITNLGSGLGRVTGNTPGSASVTYILPSGCTATAVFTVNPLPAAITGGGGSVCSGAITTVTDATPGGTWSTSGTGILTVGSLTGIVTGIAAGTGYVTYTLSSTGCKVDTTVVVYTMPAAITGPASLFLGSPITLSDAVAGGTWSSSTLLVATVGLTTGRVTGISVGSVTITYNRGGSCYVTRRLTVMPAAGRSRPLEVERGETERERGSMVSVSPNPGDGGFVINLNWAKEETVHITISNVAGIKIKEWSAVTVKDGSVSIPVQIDVASGVYLLSIEGQDFNYVTKVMVER